MTNDKPGREGHYPYQTTIESYGDGGFRFAGMSHRGSLLCLPTGMHAWPVREAGEINAQSLAFALQQAAQLDVFFLGVGHDIAAIHPELRKAFAEQSCVLEPISTGSAVRTYNILLGEERAVGAALIAVDNPFAR